MELSGLLHNIFEVVAVVLIIGFVGLAIYGFVEYKKWKK
jgi:hypothetical protein